jgi:predicted SAM-dependent methyltransferase
MKRLNLGCGEKILPGYENYDMYQDEAIHIDLNDLPLPIESNYADEILLSHVLEHVEYPYELIMECHRILKKGGVLKVILPTYLNVVQHKRWYHSMTYLSTLYAKSDTKDKRDYEFNDFSLVSFKKGHPICSRRAIKTLYMRLISWINSLFYREYRWTLMKER